MSDTGYCRLCSLTITPETGKRVVGSDRHWLCNAHWKVCADHPLTAHLACFVPLEIAYLRERGGIDDTHLWAVARYMKKYDWFTLDDAVLYGSALNSQRKEVSARIARITEGLAIMAFVPGGVTLGILHFEEVMA